VGQRMGENREQAFAIELLNARFAFQDPGLQRPETCTFAGQEEREALQRNMFSIVEDPWWGVKAWVLLDNHHRVFIRTNHEAWDHTSPIRPLHFLTARHINGLDITSGTRVWQNDWGTLLPGEKGNL